MFYVGNQGRFDAIIRSVLQDLQHECPQINHTVVLAYMPDKQTEYDDYSDTMLPERIESIHPRYTISWRNNWMPSTQIISSPISPIPGAAQHSMLRKQDCKRK